MLRTFCFSKRPMEYKTHYDKAELDELKTWFETHRDALPTSFDDGATLVIPDLHHTIDIAIDQLKKPNYNISFSGQLYHLFLLRDKLKPLA